MKELPQNYEAIATEKKWQKEWQKSGVYNWNEKVAREDSYVIDTPPPTVSGSLHMGHIYSYTQADFIARFQRMIGKNVFYPMGFDDNGLPTERLVEKTKKTKAHLHTREDFIKMCNEVAEGARKDFRNLFESIALSVDWNQEYYTISDESRRISQMSFLDLYKKNEVYRKLQPMFWDPIDQTAIAQAEIEEKELDSFENFIWFGLIDENADIKNTKWEDLQKVEIMTTRPELLAACVALVVHPDDVNKYKGKKAVTPLFNAIVPIIADDKVDKEKGTGVVMCCTFGDETDIFWQRKHNLELRIIIDKFGKLRVAQTDFDNWPCLNSAKAKEVFANLENVKTDHQDKKLSAKMKSIELLEQNGLTAKEKKAIKHSVKCAERSGSPLELIPTNQWFVKVIDHKEALKKKADECIWRPEFMKHRIHQWIDGLSWDWCISRQRYFGVPFPVWFSKRAGEEGKIIVADINKLPVNPLVDMPEGYTKDEVTPEADVMDTWATSSVSPQLSSKAINKDFAVDYNRHQKLFPADLRPQAHEIIRTWAFYTIVKAHLHENSIPWKNLMISGWCLAEDKSKMSKSKGNVVTPVEIIAENSADVVRYWASTSRLGADTAFSKDVLKIGRKLANKLWNATKFAAIFLPLIEKEPVSAADDIAKGIITEPLDKWAISRLAKTIEVATKEFENYEYSSARMAIEDFFWNVFCDNYLEAVKGRYYDESPENKQKRLSAIHTIYHCLDGILRLFAPIMPHVTEELYQAIFENKIAKTKNNSIHSTGFWPSAKDYTVNAEAEKAGEMLVTILNEVRKIKADKNVSVKYPVDRISVSVSEQNKKLINSFDKDLRNVTSAKEILFNSSSDDNISVVVELAEKAEVA
jgi:valyl-tRNA synthetase